MGIDEYKFIDITENPPELPLLTKIYQQTGEDIRKFFNTSGAEYKTLNMKDKIPRMSEKDILIALSENGKLLKRPLITDGVHSTVGYTEETFVATWKKYS